MQNSTNTTQNMQENVRSKRRRIRRIWRNCVSVMACVVVFCVTYALILPAITMEKDTFCGVEAHVHEAQCYEGKYIVCDPAGDTELPVLHTHDALCYDGETLICTLAELAGHIHTDGCYETVTIEAHSHTESCHGQVKGALICTAAEDAGHTHTDACYVPGETLICAEEEREGHFHGDACYAVDSQLTCTLAEGEGHSHSDGCYTTENTLTCTEEHTHGEDCYTQTQKLVCTTPEAPAHAHAEGCYTETKTLICQIPEDPGHVHANTCYEQVLNCGEEEREGHTHTDACYEMVDTIVCGKEESAETVTVYNLVCTQTQIAPHTHDGSCSDENGNLICTIQNAIVHQHTEACVQPSQREEDLICELQVHEHTLICYSDPTADLETAEDWEKTFADLELSGDWHQDVVALAKTQLGYEESTKNYIVEGDNPKGYTRYGDWYGIPYGDWCAMFASFCLDYAGVEGMPLDCNCPNWINALTEADLYHNEEEYVPVSGDLIFYDWNADGSSDHVGIVVEFTPAGEDTPATVRTIEGNSGNCVKYNEYNFDDTTIMGYGTIPPHLTEEEQAQVDAVVAIIDAIPSADEIDAKIEEFEEAEDYEGEEAWLTEVYQQVAEVYKAYSELSEEQKTCVTNADKLLELEYIWSVMVLPEETTEETPEEADTTVYHCGYSDEHAHGDGATCLMVDGNCVLPEHTHSDECAAEHIVYCEKTAHVHTFGCYSEEGVLTCTAELHAHEDNCYQEPDDELNLEGNELYYAAKTDDYQRYYQWSSYGVAYDIHSFVLIPGSELEDGEWEPSPIEWSGKADANYIVAYCSDDRTVTSPTNPDTYRTYSINNSRFTTDLQQRKMAAIIGNSYPFLTLEEAKAVMVAAGVKDAENCTAHELTTAAQWAVWATVETVSHLEESDICDVEFGDTHEATTVNPLEAGPPLDENIRARIVAVKEWLCSLTTPVQLEVISYDPVITANEDGTYNLVVTVSLNREIEPDERAEFNLTAGKLATTLSKLPAGESSFEIVLENLTEAELAAAKVNLNISGYHMQAYFYDSQHYQDMVGGNWEYYNDDLSFDLGLERIDVAVTKVWTEENTLIDSIEVQLLANGSPYGDAVTLSDANDWHYIWKNLKKYSVTEITKDIEDRIPVDYTIMEVPIEGYYSSNLTVDTFESVQKVLQWQEVETFDGAGQYVFVADSGALGAECNENRPSNWPSSSKGHYISMVPVNLSSASVTEDRVIWNVEAYGSGYSIESVKYPGWYMNCNYERVSTTPSAHVFENGLLGYGGYYFGGFYSNGYQLYTNNMNKVMHFRLYKLVELELPTAEKNFVLTNTLIPEGTTTDVSVTKKWSGRPDGIYPESVQVQLMQTDIYDGDSEPYGYAVTLDASNNWSYTWSDLPEYILEGDTYHYIDYTVKEVDLSENYTSVLTEDENNTYSFTITNNWEPEEAAVKLQKADFHDPEKLLAGAEFDLYLTTNNTGDSVPGTDNVLGVKLNTESLIVGQNGTMTLPVVPGESYYLVETKAPDGYNRMEEPIGFSVSKRGTRVTLTLLSGTDWAVTESGTTAILTVKNKIGYVLPETGGTGTQMYTMAGLMLMLISTAYLLYRCRKRRREVP